MNQVVHNPIFGQVYMASRYYNSKRIIMEPFLLEGVPPTPLRAYSGKWVLDGKKTSRAYSLEEFNPKWVERKIKAISDEIETLKRHRDNLMALSQRP